MANGYWIVRVDITDQEQYKLYMAANAAPFKKYGARFLVRSGRFENPEGTSRSRNVVLEFPTTRLHSSVGSLRSIKRQSNCVSQCPPLISSSSKGTTARSRSAVPGPCLTPGASGTSRMRT
jgi:uncharacterized protein (DUF1330 family)